MSSDATHVALLRGINVGGNNIVPMAELRAALDDAGLGPTATYIQSGNVLCVAPGRSEEDVASTVARVLEERFGVATPVVVITIDVLADAVANAPAGFGADETDKWDVVFLRPELSVEDAHAVVTTREGVDEAWRGERVLYFRRNGALVGRSYLSKIAQTPEYRAMTIRNWRTTRKLLELARA